MKNSKFVKVAITSLAIVTLGSNTAYAMPINVGNKQNTKKAYVPKKLNLNVGIGNIQVSKIANNITSNTTYQPSLAVPSTGNIATAGTIITYKIPISFTSTTSKRYNITDFKVNVNPTAQYMSSSDSSGEEKAENEIAQAVQKQISTVGTLSTGSTVMVTVALAINQADWNMDLNPNISISYKCNGVVGESKINLAPIKLTNLYSESLITNSNITKGTEKNNYNLNVGFQEIYYQPNEPGIYNPANRKVKSISFKIQDLNTKEVQIIPYLNKNFTYDKAAGEYTITGTYLNQNNLSKLFDLKTLNDGLIYQNILIQPTNVQYENMNNVALTTNITYQESLSTLEQKANDIIGSSAADITQTSQFNQDWYNPYNTYQTTIKAGLVGNYNVYSGSIIDNGQAVAISNGQMQIKPSQTFVSLNNASMKIMNNGTIEQKEALMQNIINGKLDSDEAEYSYNDIKNNLGKISLKTINFVYSAGKYTGQTVTVGNNYPVITLKKVDEGRKYIIAKTITLALLDGNTTDEQNKIINEQLSNGINKNTDGIISKDGKVTGFMLSDNNQINTNYVYNHWDQFPNGVGQTTNKRFNDISHNISTMNMTYASGISISVDGSSAKNSVKLGNWISDNHDIKINLSYYHPGITMELTKNTKVKIDMGCPFSLNGPIKFGGIVLNNNQYQIVGNDLIVTAPKEISANSSIEYSIHYENFNPEATINISAQYDGGVNDPTGRVLNINGNKEVEALINNPGRIVTNSKITVINTQLNDCQSYYTPVNSNDVTTITNIIHNSCTNVKTYLVIGDIPQESSDTLSGNLGFPSAGNLSVNYISGSLSTQEVPTWVLPKSALDKGINQNLVTNPNALEMKGELDYIENPSNGWVLYKPGMDIGDIVAYASTPTLSPGQNFVANYNAKLENVEARRYQYVTTAFKYYDMTNNLANTSNINIIPPVEENLDNKWISTVVREDNVELTSSDLNKKVTVDGKEYSLKDLVGSGNDNDGKKDLTPNTPTDNLMGRVNIALDTQVLNQLGYKLDYITVDGAKISNPAKWFKETGILNNTKLTTIKFIISKVSTDTVKVMNITDPTKPVEFKDLAQSVTGEPNTSTGFNSLKIPAGYHIVRVMVNAKEVPNTTILPTEFTNENTNTIYYVAKNKNKLTVSEVYANGGDVVPSKITDIIDGTSISSLTGLPKVVEGYHISEILLDGKVVTANELPITMPNIATTIQYVIAKNAVDTVKVMNITDPTKPVEFKDLAQSVTGVPNAKTGLKSLVVPADYHLVKVTVNAKEVANDTGVPADFTNADVNTVYYVAKNQNQLTVSEVYANGGVVVPSKTTSVVDGSNITTLTGLPKTVEGYYITEIILNGKQVTAKELPTEMPLKATTIQYVIAKNAVDTVKVMNITDPTKPVEFKTLAQSVTGVLNSKTGLKSLVVPVDYHLVKVTVNGKEVANNTGVPADFTNIDVNTVYYVAKKQNQLTVSEVYANGGAVVPSKTTSVIDGTNITTLTGLAKVVKGYHVTKILLDGKEVTAKELPIEMPLKATTIQYVIAKNAVDTIKVMNITDPTKPVEFKTLAQSVTGVPNSKTGLKSLVVPVDYHLVKVTVNGKEVANNTGVPADFTNIDVNTVYYVAKNQNQLTVSEVYENGGVVVPSKTTSVVDGTNITTLTGLPKTVEGYHVTEILLDGKQVTASELPKVMPLKATTIQYVIAKNPVDIVKIIDITNPNDPIEDGMPQVVEGLPGSKTGLLNPTIPSGYHLVEVTVNDKKVDENTKVPIVFTNQNTMVIYYIVKNKDVNPNNPDNNKIPNTNNTNNNNSNKDNINNNNSNIINNKTENDTNNNNQTSEIKPAKADNSNVQELPDTGLNVHDNNLKNDIYYIFALLGSMILFIFRKKK